MQATIKKWGNSPAANIDFAHGISSTNSRSGSQYKGA